jgi:hypothetical protein
LPALYLAFGHTRTPVERFDSEPSGVERIAVGAGHEG